MYVARIRQPSKKSKCRSNLALQKPCVMTEHERVAWSLLANWFGTRLAPMRVTWARISIEQCRNITWSPGFFRYHVVYINVTHIHKSVCRLPAVQLRVSQIINNEFCPNEVLCETWLDRFCLRFGDGLLIFNELLLITFLLLDVVGTGHMNWFMTMYRTKFPPNKARE